MKKSNIKAAVRRFCGIVLASAVSVPFFAGCASENDKLPEVKLSLWTDESNEPLLREQLDSFAELHKDEAVFEFTISMEGEDTCKETVLADPEGAADIYTFADDQFEELCLNDVLLEITKDTQDVTDACGGEDSSAIQAATYDGRLYAYPETAGNSYFLYYNKAYFSPEDVKSMDTILAKAEESGKKFTMDYGSGWYIYSFFKGAGLDLSCADDGVTNICNWNAADTEPYTGVDVARAMLDISSSKAFVSLNDDGFVEGVKDGTVIAGINGAWNAETVEQAWGENFAAAKLPTFTIKGSQEQMCCFTGFKLVGINKYTEYPDYCMELASYLTDEENQLKRFEYSGECPVNINAAANEDVQASPVVSALAQQSSFGYIQSVADPFWDASSKLGVYLASGNPDGRDLQQLLDEAQQAIVEPSVNK